ncbi:ubiquitin carboxyl-terminal hydrolase 10-A-like [Watersipora subatra]|uniref:ubiquitin carboxyl-terminal hydrolase 10-A-like n=1 Tax=Watersipora subatra TaxID=2589382 RepID=UPI00355C9A2C
MAHSEMRGRPFLPQVQRESPSAAFQMNELECEAIGCETSARAQLSTARRSTVTQRSSHGGAAGGGTKSDPPMTSSHLTVLIDLILHQLVCITQGFLSWNSKTFTCDQPQVEDTSVATEDRELSFSKLPESLRLNERPELNPNAKVFVPRQKYTSQPAVPGPAKMENVENYYRPPSTGFMPSLVPVNLVRPFTPNMPTGHPMYHPHTSQLQRYQHHQPPAMSMNQHIFMASPIAQRPHPGGPPCWMYNQSCNVPPTVYPGSIHYPLPPPQLDSHVAECLPPTPSVIFSQPTTTHHEPSAPTMTLLKRDVPVSTSGLANGGSHSTEIKVNSTNLLAQNSVVDKEVNSVSDGTGEFRLQFCDVDSVSEKNDSVKIMTRRAIVTPATQLMKNAGNATKSPVTTPSTEVIEDISTVNTTAPEPMVTTTIAKKLLPNRYDSKSSSLTDHISYNSVSSTHLGCKKESVVSGPPTTLVETPAGCVSSITSELSSPTVTLSSVSSADHVSPSPPQPMSWAKLFTNSSSSPVKPADTLPTPKKVVPPISLTNGASDEIGALLEKLTINPVAVPLHARRLINKTNWCYVNSTLQALLACPPFYHTLKAIPAYPPLSNISARQSSMPVLDAMVEFVNAFEVMQPEKQVEKARTRRELRFGEPFEPSSVYNVLKVMTNSEAMFTKGKQEDAEEFLTCLLNKMKEEMATAINKYRKEHNSSVVNGQDPSSAEEDGEEEWRQVEQRNNSAVTHSNVDKIRTPILNIFGGQLRSILHTGSNESVTIEQFFTVPLNVQTNKTVEEALHAFVSEESIDDYTCPQTKQKLNAHRKLTFELLPPILILHLKCFVYDKHGGSQKVFHEMDFNDTLEFDKELLAKSGPKGQRSYNLFAVVYHSGVKTTGGHYHTDVYHTGVQSWVRFDDNSTSLIEKSDVFKSKHPCVPYLLYYRRADHR